MKDKVIIIKLDGANMSIDKVLCCYPNKNPLKGRE